MPKPSPWRGDALVQLRLCPVASASDLDQATDIHDPARAEAMGVARMVSRLTRVRTFTERRLPLTGSDLLLAFITLNVLVSGVLDWNRGEPIALPVVPRPFNRWHLLAGVVLSST